MSREGQSGASLLERRAARIERVLRQRLPIPCKIETPNLTATLDDEWLRETAARIASIKYAALDSVGASAEHTPRGLSGDSVSFPLTNTVEDEERASWADREPDDPPS